MTETEKFEALEQLSYERLYQWDLNNRQRLVAYWIVRLSFGGYGAGERRADVRLTGLLLSELTGLHEPDVTNVVRSLKKAGLIDVSGSQNRPRRFSFLPQAKLVMPHPAVEESVQKAALIAIAQMQSQPGEEPGNHRAYRGPGAPIAAQRVMDLGIDTERLQREQETASRELALQSRTPRDRRNWIEGRLTMRGWDAPAIELTRPLEIDRLEECFVTGQIEALRGRPPNPGDLQISKTLISRGVASDEASQISESLIPTVTVNSQLTVNRTEISARSTVTKQRSPSYDSEAEISESLIRVADAELMAELRELVGPLWATRDAAGKGNWGSLWNRALRSSPVAWKAARESINSYKTLMLTQVVPNVGGFLWGAFKRIHPALLEKHRRAKGVRR